MRVWSWAGAGSGAGLGSAAGRLQWMCPTLSLTQCLLGGGNGAGEGWQPLGRVQAGLRASQGAYECCRISGPVWKGINVLLLQFWRGTPGTFKSPSGWLPAPGKNLVLHPRTGSGNLCSHPGLIEVSLGEEGWDYVPFLLPSLDPQVLCCPTPVPRCANWGLKVVSPQGCPSL